MDGRARWRHLANTVERLCAATVSGFAIRCGDAASSQITWRSVGDINADDAEKAYVISEPSLEVPPSFLLVKVECIHKIHRLLAQSCKRHPAAQCQWYFSESINALEGATCNKQQVDAAAGRRDLTYNTKHCRLYTRLQNVALCYFYFVLSSCYLYYIVLFP